ncbi:hypothetical protein DICPUDRAFT_37355, partial [Dictyostelium purpureum]
VKTSKMDNSNNYNDKLFFRVWRNQYLLRLIFHFIHTVEWVKPVDYRYIGFSFRKKFKNITTMESLIDKKLFQLLKCKLEAKEFI